MDIVKVRCPSCGGKIKIDKNDNKGMYCPYCGEFLLIDNGEIFFSSKIDINKKSSNEINKNININKTSRYIYDDEIIKETAIDKENKRKHVESILEKILWIFYFLFIIGLLGFLWYMGTEDDRVAEKALASGYIQIGESSSSLKGKNYETIVKKLSAEGFTNIKTVDLDDSGILFFKNEKIESVSIDGVYDFDSDDFFSPRASIIITYH